ncbi:MAG: hypothetical protein ABIQ86_12425 [Steroidobacteraceae bacterium]
MHRFRPVAAALLLGTLPVAAPAADDVGSLRAELQAMKSEYSARVEALESRIQQLEAQVVAADGKALVAAIESPPPEAPAARLGGGASAFNPAISLILGGSYTSTSRNPDDWNIAGFQSNGGEVGPGGRSFNLGESELTFSASIDPYFTGQMTAAITGEDEIGVEEAFVRTSALPDGFTGKLGRFFSGFGYLNEVHAHAWDFVDQPLVYQALFGGQFKQNGVQVKWLAPTNLFVELGGEAGNGEGFPSTRRARNGLNGAALFAHVGGDIGDYTSWRSGVSWLNQHAEDREGGIVDAAGQPLFETFTGDSRTVVVDAVFKWAPTPRRQLKVQGEYMRRHETGDIAGTAVLLANDYRSTQSGWYLQSVYQFAPRWRVGARYDSLDSGTPRYTLAPAGLLSSNPDRLSLMLDWNPSEFSRLRVQYDWDDARDDDDRDRILRLQYIYGIGAHGAHKY